MDKLPVHIIAFGLFDRFWEPFCYGCATFILSYRWTRSKLSKVIAIMVGVLLFLWMDDIWPGIGFHQGQFGLAAGNPEAEKWLNMIMGQEVGTAKFTTGESSGLFGIPQLSISDILSGLYFVTFGFLSSSLCANVGETPYP